MADSPQKEGSGKKNPQEPLIACLIELSCALPVHWPRFPADKEDGKQRYGERYPSLYKDQGAFMVFKVYQI